jgi:UDP-3-O-[3-hydroxymyristoyl] glucosamine N-acyltransferase
MYFNCDEVLNLETMETSPELKNILKNLSPQDLANSDEGSICYLDKNRQISNLSTNKIGLLVTNSTEIESLNANIVLVHSNPRFVFAKICHYMYPVIDKMKRIDKKFKENSNLKIGKSNLVTDMVKFGRNLSIGNFNSIGIDGFSVEIFKNEVVRLPHYGDVMILDNVTIGSNVSICKSVFNSTIIGRNVQIDDGVHIAHNVTIGNNTTVAAHSVIAGSVTLGSNCRLGVNVIIENGVAIGDNTVIGSGAVVLRSVPSNSKIIARPGVVF